MASFITFSTLESLPREILEKVAILLDPASLVALMSASSVVSRVFECNAVFWTEYGKANRLPSYSRMLKYGEAAASANSHPTLAHQLVALDKNLRSGQRQTFWFQPFRTGEGQFVEGKKSTKPKMPGFKMSSFYWNGRYFVVAANGLPITVFDTHAPGAPVRLGSLAAKEKSANNPVVMWKNYLLFPPSSKTSVAANGELILLKIFDVEEECSNWSEKSPVAVASVPVSKAINKHSSADLSGACVVRLLESSSKEKTGKAVVLHFRLSKAAFIIRLPDGVVERKFNLPFTACLWTGFMQQETNLHVPSVVNQFLFYEVGSTKFDRFALLKVEAVDSDITMAGVTMDKSDRGIHSTVMAPGGIIFDLEKLQAGGNIRLSRSRHVLHEGPDLQVDKGKAIEATHTFPKWKYSLHSKIFFCRDVDLLLVSLNYRAIQAFSTMLLPVYEVDFPDCSNIGNYAFDRFLVITEGGSNGSVVTHVTTKSGQVIGTQKEKNRRFLYSRMSDTEVLLGEGDEFKLNRYL